jgi:xylulokinase
MLAETAMGNILTIDMGTSGIKVCLFDNSLKLICSGSEEYILENGPRGYIEVNPQVYLDVLGRICNKMFVLNSGKEKSVLAVVVTSQGETIIPVDKSGRPLRNAIVWLDGRADEQAQRLYDKFPPEYLFASTGVAELSATVPLAKVLWLREKEPEIFCNMHKILLVEDYLLYWFTGKYITEKTLLSSTAYYNIVKDCYYYEILDAAGLSVKLFPKNLESGTAIGPMRNDIAGALGLKCRPLVFTGAMDQVCAALAAGNYKNDIMTETTGTALVIGASSNTPDFHNPARTIIYRHVMPGLYIVIPVCMTAGILLKWFNENFCGGIKVCPYSLLDKMADEIPPGSGGLAILPFFTGIMTPEINPKAKGVFFGLDLSMKKGHVIRAILESVGYMLKENIALISSATGSRPKNIRCLGGASSSDLWLQIKADICEIPMCRMEFPESTSLGAAMIAAVGLGWFSDYEKAAAVGNRIQKVFYPREENRRVYEKGYNIYRNLYKAVKPLFSED